MYNNFDNSLVYIKTESIKAIEFKLNSLIPDNEWNFIFDSIIFKKYNNYILFINKIYDNNIYYFISCISWDNGKTWFLKKICDVDENCWYVKIYSFLENWNFIVIIIFIFNSTFNLWYSLNYGNNFRFGRTINISELYYISDILYINSTLYISIYNKIYWINNIYDSNDPVNIFYDSNEIFDNALNDILTRQYYLNCPIRMQQYLNYFFILYINKFNIFNIIKSSDLNNIFSVDSKIFTNKIHQYDILIHNDFIYLLYVQNSSLSENGSYIMEYNTYKNICITFNSIDTYNILDIWDLNNNIISTAEFILHPYLLIDNNNNINIFFDSYNINQNFILCHYVYKNNILYLINDNLLCIQYPTNWEYGFYDLNMFEKTLNNSILYYKNIIFF